MKKLIAWVILISIVLLMPLTAFAEEDGADAQPSSVPSVSEESEPAADGGGSPDAGATETPVPTPEPTATPEQTIVNHEGAPEVDLNQVSATSAMLVDADTGEVLFAKNADWTIFPASTTKLMTAILVLENCTMDEEVTIGPEVNQFNSTSSLMGLRDKVGQQMPIQDLMYGLMMCSGNDAAVALAVHVAGSEEEFVRMMNEKAAALGMTGTHFLNSYGIYVANVGHDHYSTAADMVKLALAARQYPDLMEIMQAETYTYQTEGFSETNLVESSNYLIHTPTLKPELVEYKYDKATGMKTGTLEHIIPPGYEQPIKSYGCLVASASDGGLNLVAVIFGDLSVGDKEAGTPNAYERWNIAKYLFDYGFTNFAKVDVAQYVKPVALTEQIDGVAGNDPQEGALEISADISTEKSDVRLLDAATAQGLADGSVELEKQTNLTQPLSAPIEEGQEVGTVSYLLNGQEVYSAPLVAGRTVYPAGDELDTSKEYGVLPFTFEAWYLWVLIPVGLVLTLLIIRAVNKNRRRRTRYAGRGRKSAFSAQPVLQKRQSGVKNSMPAKKLTAPATPKSSKGRTSPGMHSGRKHNL